MEYHPLLSRFKNIKALVLDVDGVFTDGSMLIQPAYSTLRCYDIKDGMGVKLATDAGILVFVISGAGDSVVLERMKKLGIQEIHLNIENKAEKLTTLLIQYALNKQEVLYVGDDIVDLEAMQLTGLICCPKDAVDDVRACADYISPFNGGKGCLRDITEKVLRLQGKWKV